MRKSHIFLFILFWAFSVLLNAQPNLVSPGVNEVGVSIEPTFTWDAVLNAVKYQLQVREVSAPNWTDLYNNNNVPVGTSFQPGTAELPLDYYKSYQWRMRVFISGVWSGYSTARVFTTLLPAPNLTFPANNSLGHPLTPTLEWSAVVGSHDYVVRITDNAAYDTIFTTNKLYLEIPSNKKLSNNTFYYWTVTAREFDGTTYYPGATSVQRFFKTSVTGNGGISIPVLSYPIGGAVVYTKDPILYWYNGSGSNPTSFELQYKEGDNLFDEGTVYKFNNIDITSHQVFNLTPGKTYHWRVRGYSSAFSMYSAWSSSSSFKIDASLGPVTPVPSYPTGGALIYTLTPTLSWYVLSSSEDLRYRVQWKEGLAGTVNNVPNIQEQNYTFTAPLTAGATYYWRVRSIDNITGVASDYSEWVSFIIDATYSGAPVKPVLSWPVGGALVNTITPTLSWYLNAANNDFTFRVQVTKTNGTWTAPDRVLSKTTTDLSLEVNSGILEFGTTYYWRVRSEKTGFTNSAWSKVDSFKTSEGSNGTPSKIILSYPVNTTSYIVTPTFYWYAIPNVQKYQLQISTHQTNFTTDYRVFNKANITDNSFELPSANALTPGGVYYWRVRATYDGTNWGPYSTVAFVAVEGSNAPVVPMPGSPEYGVYLSTNSPTLNWYLPTSGNQISYELQYSTDEQFTNPVTISALENLSFQLNFLESDYYYWRVRSKNADGQYSNYSTVNEFGIDNPTSVGEENIIPTVFEVSPVYPNPFNPTTTIKFGLPEASFISIKVYDMLGREVKTLLNEEKNAGSYSIQWHGDNDANQKVASGNYLLRVVAGSNVKSLKMILLK
jgi:hypothetical protein